MSDDANIVPYSEKVEPTVQIHKLRLEDEIAEKKYQLGRIELELQKYINGTIKKMESEKLTLEREIAALLQKYDKLDKFGSQDVIDITNLSKQGGPNG